MQNKFDEWKSAVIHNGLCPIDPGKQHSPCPWPLSKPVPQHLWHEILIEVGMQHDDQT